MTPAHPRLLKVQTVAEDYMDCSKRTVWQLIASGALEAVKLGPRTTRVTESSVLRLIEARRGGAAR